jgi:hypothetical protein
VGAVAVRKVFPAVADRALHRGGAHSLAALHIHLVRNARIELARKVVGHMAIRAARVLQHRAHDLECLRGAFGGARLCERKRGACGA